MVLFCEIRNSVEDTSVVERFLDEEGLQESKRDKILSIIKGMGKHFLSKYRFIT